MTTEPRYAIYVIHPETGVPVWFLEPGKGITYDQSKAKLWKAEELDKTIQEAIADGGDWGTKNGEIPCRIRQVLVPITGTDYVKCPHCQGLGDEVHRPYYECHHCDGTGLVDPRHA